MPFIQHKPVSGKTSSSRKRRDILPQGLRFDVFRRDHFTCIYCGGQSPQVALECDHKTPVSKGGTDTLDNLVTSCFNCNRGKGAKTVDHNPPPVSTSIDPPVSSDPLQGLFGHSIVDGDVEWQFFIKGAVGDSHAVQMFSWLTGFPTDVKLIKTADLTGGGFKFYSTEQEWNRAADLATERRFGVRV